MKQRADGRLLVQCWCQTTTVYVPAADIWNGHTGTCGLACCHPPQSPTPTRPATTMADASEARVASTTGPLTGNLRRLTDD